MPASFLFRIPKNGARQSPEGENHIGGYRVGDEGLTYLRLGCAWLAGVQANFGEGVDGLAFGGGYEFALRARMNLRLDYRCLDYGGVNFIDNTIDLVGHEITAAILFNF